MSYPAEAAAADLLACLQAFGEQRSNPVLALLGPQAQLLTGQKYPQPALRFGGGRWRAYYHCHPEQPMVPGEHGHFHVFVRAPVAVDAERQWAHLAGLGMDGLGQPLRWFAVNAWVTADAWQPRAWLREQLAQLSQDADAPLLPAWLTGMLCLQRAPLDELLARRDDALADAAPGRSAAAVQADRSLYQLAEEPIELEACLQTALHMPSRAANR